MVPLKEEGDNTPSDLVPIPQGLTEAPDTVRPESQFYLNYKVLSSTRSLCHSTPSATGGPEC